MKNTFKKIDFDVAMSKARPKRKKPVKPNMFWRTLIRVLTWFSLAGSGATYTKERMECIGKNEPCLILMNHSCFLDMPMAYQLLYPRPLNIVCSSDAFIGFGGLMGWLMYTIGCIPTQKFVTDVSLIKDMTYALKEKKSSVLMYPEASYSFDGRATPLPRKMGVLLKKLDVPVVTVITEGAFARDPLYNCLQKRKVTVSAKVKCLASLEEVRNLSVAELDARLDEAFSFDSFRWQQENEVTIAEPFRADGLERILYRCPHCGTEGKTRGKGTTLTCLHCGKEYNLTVHGYLSAVGGGGIFSHIPNWYDWQRGLVRQEIENGTYRLDTRVDILMVVDHKALYRVGSGRLIHDCEGFHLTGCDGKLEYHQSPLASYSLYADYYWYELGDVICIGTGQEQYCCIPRGKVSVAKARLAAEEMYKVKKHRKTPVKA